MRKIEAGTRVASGYYLSLSTWTLHPVARNGELLTGRAGEQFAPVPTLAAFALAPVLGALFLMFLPIVGFWLTCVAATRPAARLANRIATAFAATVEPGWEPGHAHLTGKPARAAAVAEPARVEEDPLDVLEREITAMRNARRAS